MTRILSRKEASVEDCEERMVGSYWGGCVGTASVVQGLLATTLATVFWYFMMDPEKERVSANVGVVF